MDLTVVERRLAKIGENNGVRVEEDSKCCLVSPYSTCGMREELEKGKEVTPRPVTSSCGSVCDSYTMHSFMNGQAS